MAIDIQNKKIELIQWLSTLEDAAIIDKIMALRDDERNDWWNKISEEEQESIETGIRDADQGKLNSHTQVRKNYEKWL
ncbi:hypothetical protein [Mangrovibacterium marinum]|nr:hypothetical protein [Mangrovibacterium marinum]